MVSKKLIGALVLGAGVLVVARGGTSRERKSSGSGGGSGFQIFQLPAQARAGDIPALKSEGSKKSVNLPDIIINESSPLTKKETSMSDGAIRFQVQDSPVASLLRSGGSGTASDRGGTTLTVLPTINLSQSTKKQKVASTVARTQRVARTSPIKTFASFFRGLF